MKYEIKDVRVKNLMSELRRFNDFNDTDDEPLLYMNHLLKCVALFNDLIDLPKKERNHVYEYATELGISCTYANIIEAAHDIFKRAHDIKHQNFPNTDDTPCCKFEDRDIDGHVEA